MRYRLVGADRLAELATRTGVGKRLFELALHHAQECRERLPERPTAHFSPEQWAVCGEAGLLGLSIPRDYGGQGLG
ncbi:acyl-CoA dehydrogenase family protein, partial [Pseudomonas aeruginosa]|uniref:acyl-CoA dehydrogenase family protein n=1 Tax=Pseudomonas aeruginosa TaxID=287 RepID=UPI0023584CE2